MGGRQKLILIKAIHTLIWVFYNVVVFYMLYASVAGKFNALLLVCYGLVLLEGVVLLFFKFTCPLTLIAQRYTFDRSDNFDIYLPQWLARNTKRIYTAIVFVALLAAVLHFV